MVGLSSSAAMVPALTVHSRARMQQRGITARMVRIALDYGDHRKLFLRNAKGLHVAQHGDGERRGRTHGAVGRLELTDQR